MNQQKLSFTPAPAAHGVDTSQEAAAKVTESGKHASIQARVLAVLKDNNHGMGLSNEELCQHITNCRTTSVVSACNSLVKRGLVRDSGRRRLSPTSLMRVIVWIAV